MLPLDDVMQDVFVRMQRGLPTLRDEERFTSWLFQIARNSVADHMRTRAHHPLPGGEEPDDRPRNLTTKTTVRARSLSGCV
ncbi:MAG: sigma factor [Kofleriaceae bacterium]